jgi:hypothetical protein
MSKTNHTSNFGHANLDHRELTDTELDAVTGGIIPGESTDMGQKDWVDTSDPTARRPLGTSCYVGWISTKHVTVK